MSLRLMVVIALVCLPLQGWAQPEPDGLLVTFSASALASHAREKMLVVAAGDAEELTRARGAATLLIEGLRKSTHTRLVMDAQALGDLAALSDEEIAARAGQLPVDVVVVIRAYKAKVDHTFVLGFFVPGGARTYSEIAIPGEPLPAHKTLPRREVLRREVPRREVFIPKLEILEESHGDGIVGRAPESGKRYVGAAIYRELGRPELATVYEDRERLRTQISIGGFLVGGAGVGVGTLMMLGVFDSSLCASRDPEVACNSKSPLGPSLAISGGLLWLAIGLYSQTSLHPMTATELRALARRQNVHFDVGPRGAGVRGRF